MQFTPSLDKPSLPGWQRTRDHLDRIDAENSNLILIVRMKMSGMVRRARLGEHSNDDPEEPAQLWHSTILQCCGSRARFNCAEAAQVWPEASPARAITAHLLACRMGELARSCRASSRAAAGDREVGLSSGFTLSVLKPPAAFRSGMKLFVDRQSTSGADAFESQWIVNAAVTTLPWVWDAPIGSPFPG